jgi:hypothetical protein
MMQDDGPLTFLTETVDGGVEIEDSKTACFTAFVCLENTPTTEDAGLIDFYDTAVARSWHGFFFFMDTDGYMNITARNTAGTEILNVQITNNGGSFADTTMYQFAVVINLDDVTKRSIWINNVDVTDNTGYVTWNTYTDDYMQLKSQADDPNGMQYLVGGNGETAHSFSYSGNGGTGYGTGATAYDSLGYISFDNACNLISPAIWDSDGYVLDPQKWEGWYKAQPKYFFGPSLYRNTGSLGTAFEMNGDITSYTYAYDSAQGDRILQSINCIVNYNISGTI